MTNAIETNQLTKRFGDVLAVDAIDLRVGKGEIYGFLAGSRAPAPAMPLVPDNG